MRLPRDVSRRDLVRALETFGYVVLRQTGSHIRLGTLAGVVADVAAHHGLSKNEVVQRLFGDR